jgi:hypothetical protein
MSILNTVSKILVKLTSEYGEKVKSVKNALPIPDAKPIKYSGDAYNLGFAMADINPEITDKPLYIAGHGSGHVMSGVLSDVYVSCAYIGLGEKGLLWLSADIVGLTLFEGDIIRERIYKTGVFPKDTVITITATHSHSGIDTIGYWGKPFASIPSDGKDPDYMEKLYKACVSVAVRAYENRKEGKLYAGSAEIKDGLTTGRNIIDKHEIVSRLRFVANDGEETWIVNFGGHPNSLGGGNRFLSGEYPYFLRRHINDAGANMLFGVGTIGGMDVKNFDNKNRIRSIVEQGKMIFDGLLTIENERELAPEMSVTVQDFYLPVDNNVLAFLAKKGTMSFIPYPSDIALTGIAMKTRMTYMIIGDQKILTLPGEMFANTVYGSYNDSDTSSTGLGAAVNPKPLVEICDDENLIVFGVTDDMTGYCLPPNDFVLNKNQPFLTSARDRFGKNHYHETNSMGVNTQKVIADTFERVVNNN